VSVQVLDREVKPHPWIVDYSNVAADCRWAWDGLVLAWPLWESGYDSVDFFTGDFERVQARDPIRARHGSVIGFTAAGVDFADGRRGRVAKVDTTIAGRITTPESSYLPTGPITVVLHYRRLDSTNRNTGAFGPVTFESGGTNLCGVHLPYGDGNVYWDYGGFSGANRVTYSGASFGDDVWVFTNGPRGSEIWQNGILRATNGGTPLTRTASSSTNGWGLFYNVGAANDNAESGGFLLYDRQFSESEIATISQDPWTPFRPERSQEVLVGVSARITQAGHLVATDSGRVRISGAGLLAATDSNRVRVTQSGLLVAQTIRDTAQVTGAPVMIVRSRMGRAELSELVLQVGGNVAGLAALTALDLSVAGNVAANAEASAVALAVAAASAQAAELTGLSVGVTSDAAMAAFLDGVSAGVTADAARRARATQVHAGSLQDAPQAAWLDQNALVVIQPFRRRIMMRSWILE
jgi:hypothetical protein